MQTKNNIAKPAKKILEGHLGFLFDSQEAGNIGDVVVAIMF